MRNVLDSDWPSKPYVVGSCRIARQDPDWPQTLLASPNPLLQEISKALRLREMSAGRMKLISPPPAGQGFFWILSDTRKRIECLLLVFPSIVSFWLGLGYHRSSHMGSAPCDTMALLVQPPWQDEGLVWWSIAREDGLGCRWQRTNGR